MGYLLERKWREREKAVALAAGLALLGALGATLSGLGRVAGQQLEGRGLVPSWANGAQVRDELPSADHRYMRI